MVGTISVILLDIYICKLEEDIVAPSKPLFYKRWMIPMSEEKRMKLMNFRMHQNRTTEI